MKKYLILFAAIFVLLFAAGCTEQTNVSEEGSSVASSAGESSWENESLADSSEGEDSRGESSYIEEISIPWSEDESSDIDPLSRKAPRQTAPSLISPASTVTKASPSWRTS